MARLYTDEIKAQVIAEATLGATVKGLARKYDMPEATVRYWRDTARAQPVLAPEKKDDLGHLVYDYIAATLRALTAQAEVVAEPEYIRAQPADKLYLLHGTMADKAVSVLERLDARSDDPTEREANDSGRTAQLAD